MKLNQICLAFLLLAGAASAQDANSEPAAAGAIRERIQSYIAAFNNGDAQALGSYWTQNGVSTVQLTGEQTVGRAALASSFSDFFKEQPGARLTGTIDNVRMVRDDVATVSGRSVLYAPGAEPVQSGFSAILVKEGSDWFIDSSQEHELPAPSSPYQALQELEWLVGTWVDQTDGPRVTTAVRWSLNRSFLIRSFSVTGDAAELTQGTQVIGWDPLAKQIRSWTFTSDGSFGQGTIAKHDEEWLVKKWQILGDGRLATGTKVISRVDDNTMTVQTVGETVDGEPTPSSEAVTVIRTGGAAPASGVDSSEQGGNR